MTTRAKERAVLRQAVADYLGSEGCSCCEGDAHGEHRERLAKLLGIRKKDNWYDFTPYRTARLASRAARKGRKR